MQIWLFIVFLDDNPPRKDDNPHLEDVFSLLLRQIFNIIDKRIININNLNIYQKTNHEQNF